MSPPRACTGSTTRIGGAGVVQHRDQPPSAGTARRGTAFRLPATTGRRRRRPTGSAPARAFGVTVTVAGGPEQVRDRLGGQRGLREESDGRAGLDQVGEV